MRGGQEEENKEELVVAVVVVDKWKGEFRKEVEGPTERRCEGLAGAGGAI